MIEQIVDAAVEKLVSGLPDAIEARNDTIDDDLTLVVPANIYPYVPSPGELNEFPSIGIGDLPARLEDDIGSSATGLYGIYVIVYVQAAAQGELARLLRRYQSVVKNVILEGRHLQPAAWGVTLQGIDPGPTLIDDATNPKEWVSWTGLRITCKADEEW